MKLFTEILIYTFLISFINADNKLRLVKEWKEFDFEFPDEAAKLDAESKNHFTRGESVPIDIDVHYSGNKTKIFVTIPRFGPGRPFTLATLSNKNGLHSQLLKPYPDYSWHVNQGNECKGMTSVFRIAIDECQRLWVVDTGFIGDDRICPTKILVFDLITDTIIKQHPLDLPILRQHSLLVTTVVDVRDPHEGCRDTFAYIADVTGYGIVVYDLLNDKSWRVENKLTYPFPPYGTFHIQGEEFDLMDGVIGMALSPFRYPLEDRTLYFHALASITENYVKTSVLRNASAWDGTSTPNTRDFQVFKGTRQSQSVAEAMDKSGVLFFGLLTPCSIACWNSATEYSPSNIDTIVHNHETLQFPSGVKIVNNLEGQQELWVISCRLQKLMTGTMNTNEINFRVQAGKVKRLLQGTKCNRPNGATSYQNNFVGGKTTPYGTISNYGGSRYR